LRLAFPEQDSLEKHGAVTRLLIGLLLVASATGCGRELAVQPAQQAVVTPQHSPAAGSTSLWIAPGVPDSLRQLAEGSNIPIAAHAAEATIVLGPDAGEEAAGTTWLYALAAPFPTVLDGISAQELQAVWAGTTGKDYASWPLFVTSSTAAALEQLWGAPGPTTEIMDPELILDRAWADRPSWAILPFEDLEPRWKVLSIDGQSPIRNEFDVVDYPLAMQFSLTGADSSRIRLDVPSTNRDPSRLTTILMSGTSGLVRELAYQMEVHGISYPARDIGGWLREADVFHISHEASFDPTCPPPNPLKSRFSCSSPKYIGLFDDVGLDVVELTGNHIMDNGSASMLFSLDLYREHGISYYGGGANLDDARQPLRMEHNGNRFAFLGCNFAEPPQPLAGSNLPGANPCDWTDLSRQIDDLRHQGYIPIVTLQYKEGYSPIVMPWQSIDFRRAAEAGAAIVSGSQSHVPMQMEFYDGAFIHYGLGNLFFGQMANQPPGPGLPLQPAQRYEFLDRHVLYNGRHISTELLTAMLEDYARPRPMTAHERSAILESYFAYSGWLPLIPTPAPAKTPTLYPLLKFVPLPTYTPFPRSTPTP
jgi:poly-gamma-glutamate synthesis protein (capsule biosynthesis protein)